MTIHIHPAGRYRMYMMVMMVPWRDYLKQVLLFHYFPIVSFSTEPVSPALISSPLAHLLLWTPQQPSSEGSITMKQETHIANRFYQMVAVLNPASHCNLNQCPRNDFPSIFSHRCLVDAFPRLWPMSGPSLEDFFHKVSDLPIGYENPRTNGRYFDVMRLILSKHLKQNDASSIINTSRMLQWNWDASKGDWDCRCASTSFSFLGVGVGFLIAEVQAQWWYKSQNLPSNGECIEAKFSQYGTTGTVQCGENEWSITLYQYNV